MSDSRGSRGGRAPVVFGVPTSARGTLPAGRDAERKWDAPAVPAGGPVSAEEHGPPARSFRSGSDGAPAPSTADFVAEATRSTDRRSQAPERDARHRSRPAEPAGTVSLDGKKPASVRPTADDTATLAPVGAAPTGTPPGDGSWFNRFPARKAAAAPTTAKDPVPDGSDHPAAAVGGLPGPANPSRGPRERPTAPVPAGGHGGDADRADGATPAFPSRPATPAATPVVERADVAGAAPSAPPSPGWASGQHDAPGARGAGPRPDVFPGGGMPRGAASGATQPGAGGPGHLGAAGPAQEGVGRPGTSTYASPDAGTYTGAPPRSAVPSAPRRPPSALRPVPDERPSDERPRPDTGAGPSSTGRTPTALRRARLRLSHVDPRAVLRISFVFSLCVFVVVVVAFAVLWMVLSQLGVFDSVVNAAQTLTDKTDGGIRDWLAFQRVMEIALVVGAVNVVLMTLLSTLGALLYNLCADLVGGVEVTLTER